jgi:hypothetical protein
MTTTGTPRVLPWLRTGLAAQITARAVEGLPPAASADVSASVELHASGTVPDLVETVPGPALRLRSPGEVIGLDGAQITRCSPEPGATDAEPNYFPHVELAAPDLPWRYTPAAADDDRLVPWIALVVVEDGPGGTLEDRPDGRCPLLHVPDPGELPDPAQSWAWAHVHSDDDLADGVDAVLATNPQALRSRLLCPRRLTANRSWLACVVPIFESGRAAGTGGPTADRLLAWDPAGSAEVVLPAYYSWRFQTGPRGDFESLVRRLTSRELPGSVGRRDLDVSHPGGGLPEVPGSRLTYAGAMVSPAGFDRPWDPDERTAMKDALRRAVNLTRVRPGGEATGRAPYQALRDDPVVGPPAYAAAQAGRRFVPAADSEPLWFDELCTEPDRRAVAGVAAEVIRADQEALVGAAWAYAADLARVNQLTARSRLAWEIGTRRVAGVRRLSNAALLQLAGPALTRLPSSAGGTIWQAVADSDLPAGLVSGAFRRTCQVARGLSTRSAGGARLRPTLTATRDFLADPVTLVARWSTVQAPIGSDVAPQQESAESRRARTVPPLSDLDPLTADVRTGLDPAGTVRAMLDARITGLAADRETDAPPALYASPTFGTPMYARLAALSLEHLVPGADAVPDHTVGLLEVNRTFVEAFLAGLNHEMGREFRWREYPTPLDQTWFLRFWDSVDGCDDIVPIDDWKAGQRLGANARRNAPAADLVLLVTGPLLRRYPDVRIYAVEADWAEDGTRVEKTDGAVALPVFTGVLDDSKSFFGFALNRPTARGHTDPDDGPPGYFFVFEEQPGALRFGLDAPRERQRGSAPTEWNDLSWAHLSPAEGPLVRFVDTSGPTWIVAAGELPGNGGRDAWGDDAAAMARITVQRPVRMLVHADSMLPEEDS